MPKAKGGDIKGQEIRLMPCRLLCPESSREGCSLSVWSTPKDSENHKKQIYRRIDMCPHFKEEVMKKINTYQFTLILSGVSEETSDLEDKIFEAGCSDALIHY